MTLRYDSFLTPFASPALGRIDVSGLSDAAKALEQRAQYDQTRQDRLAQQAFQNQIEQSATEGKNRYYDAQAATHRMAQEQAKDAAFEKRSQVLFDAFRKAKTPVDRQAIRDELQRLGYSVEEQSTDLPDTTLQTTAAAEPPPVLTSKTYKNPPKPNKSFSAALGQIVADENATPTAADESTLGPGSLASVLGVPAAQAMSGEAGGASAATDIAAPPSRGGKFVIKDKSGAIVHSYDEPLERMKTQTIVNSAMGGLREAAQTTREKAAADAAIKAAAGLVDGGVDLDKAARLGLDTYKNTLAQEFKKTYPQGAGGGAAGPSKTQLKIEGMDREQEDKIIRRVSGAYDAKGMHQGIAMARRAVSSLDSGSGIGDLDAFKAYLLQMSGKVVTDKEMDQFMHSEGAWVGWEKKFNEYAAQGRFPPEFLQPLRAMFERFITLNSESLKQMGSNAREQAKRSHLSPDQQAIVYGNFTGDFGDQPSSNGPDMSSDEELVRKYRASKGGAK